MVIFQEQSGTGRGIDANGQLWADFCPPRLTAIGRSWISCSGQKRDFKAVAETGLIQPTWLTLNRVSFIDTSGALSVVMWWRLEI
jgi:hypothetical protein